MEGTPVLYDLMDRKEIACRREGEFLAFDLSLGPCNGTIIGVYPEAIAGVKAGKAAPIRLSVVGKGGQPMTGVHPLQVEIRDANGDRNEYSGYVAAENGVCTLPFAPAVNDPKGTWQMTVTELTSGKEMKTEFKVDRLTDGGAGVASGVGPFQETR